MTDFFESQAIWVDSRTFDQYMNEALLLQAVVRVHDTLTKRPLWKNVSVGDEGVEEIRESFTWRYGGPADNMCWIPAVGYPVIGREREKLFSPDLAAGVLIPRMLVEIGRLNTDALVSVTDDSLKVGGPSLGMIEFTR